jgi:hypothetical protein
MWVIRGNTDKKGVFFSQQAALRFARLESPNENFAVVHVNDRQEFDYAAQHSSPARRGHRETLWRFVPSPAPGRKTDAFPCSICSPRTSAMTKRWRCSQQRNSAPSRKVKAVLKETSLSEFPSIGPSRRRGVAQRHAHSSVQR